VSAARIPARPRLNVRSGGDRESWWKKATLRAVDFAPEPEDTPCERWGYASRCDRRPCDSCAERGEWESEVLSVVQEATGWGLYGTGNGCEGRPGRPFASQPDVYRHKRHSGVIVVSWSGGLDI
jgi:hypothetical protein